MDQIASQLAQILGKLDKIENLETCLAQLNTKIENIEKNNEKKMEELATKIFILELGEPKIASSKFLSFIFKLLLLIHLFLARMSDGTENGLNYLR
jgi:hypothetical protein